MTDKECEIETSKAIMEMRNHIAELEKENAELKEQCSILADCNTCYSSCKNENIEMKKQLTKAKEIIKDFILMAKVEHLKDRYETVDEAEQFLNSDVE